MSTLPQAAVSENEARKASRRARYDAQRFLHYESSVKRVRFCGRDSVDGSVQVKATGSGVERRAGFGNLRRCGSTWACPVCSFKIAAQRSEEIAAAIAQWHKPAFGPQPEAGKRPQGGRIIFLTLTMRHKRGQRLDDLWTNGVSAGWHAVTSGRAWEADQRDYGVGVSRVVRSGAKAGKTVTKTRIGFARVVETTQGANGWHVHIHALLFVRGDITGEEALTLGDRMFGRWVPALTAAGFGSPSLRHGVDVRLMGPKDANRVSDYFTKSVYGAENSKKAGWEAAGGRTKTANRKFGNRTPFQILEDARATGDADDLALWWEWEAASHGKRQITWSPWLRAALKLGVELTDEEIVAQDEGGEVVLTLQQFEFDAIAHCQDALLDAVESDDDMTAARAFLVEKLGSAFGGAIPLLSPPIQPEPVVVAL